MYGEDAICPCCNLETETLDHMLRCRAVGVVKNRAAAQDKLRDVLHWLKTLDKLIENLMHSISSWERLQSSGKPTSQYRGSVVPEDVALVQAFNDQTDI
jgi:hypothetical protein